MYKIERAKRIDVMYTSAPIVVIVRQPVALTVEEAVQSLVPHYFIPGVK